MIKKQGIILLSHCILNKFSQVETSIPKNPDIQRMVSYLLEKNIGIIQLPCPETHIYGLKRWGHVKEQFDTLFYRETSKKLLSPITMQVKDYIENNYVLIGIIGIEGSPSCGAFHACVSDKWGGEFKNIDIVKEKVSTLKYGETRGVFMEVLDNMLEEKDIKPKLFGLLGEEIEDLIKEIERYLLEIGF